MVGTFNTPLSSMDRSSRKKINKALNDRSDHINLYICIYTHTHIHTHTHTHRTFHPKATECSFFSSVQDGSC